MSKDKSSREAAMQYLSSKPKKENLKEDFDSTTQQRWWLMDEKNQFHSIFATVNIIENDLQTWRFQCRMYRFLYANPEAWFTTNMPNRNSGNSQSSSSRRVQVNVIQSCVDTAASMIVKNQPKPQFMTLGQDDYLEQLKARLLTKYVSGVIDSCGDNGKDLYGVMKKVFLDACLTGTGALKLYIDEGKVKAEWIFTDELVIDNIEGMRETPCQIHRRKLVPRDILIYQYPEHAEKIKSSSREVDWSVANKVNDVVEVIESWHLKSGSAAKDGRHCISIDQCTLLNEEYDKDYYPIVFFRWAERPLGFWGRGIPEELAGIQERIHNVLQVIQVSQELLAVPIIFLENGSQVTPEHMAQNGIARIVFYTGTEPHIITPGAVSPELYQHLDWLIEQAYQITGVSMAGAAGKVPQQLRSGEALREASDMAQGRFELIGQEWERCFITASKIIVNLTADLYKDNKELSVKVAGKKFLEQINWKDIDLSEEDFRGQVFPISGLPSTPAGKLDQLMDYVQAGWIDKTFAMELSGMPDLEDYISLENSSLELTRKLLSNIVNDGEYQAPTQYMNIQQSLQIANLERSRAQFNGVEQDKLEMIDLFIDQLNELTAMAQGPAQPDQSVPQAAPPQASQALPGVVQGQQ